MDRSHHSANSHQIAEIVFPRGPATRYLLAGDPQDSGISTYRDGSGYLWVLHGYLSADWISLAAVVDKTISVEADVAVFSSAARDSEESKNERNGIAMIREDWMNRILVKGVSKGSLKGVSPEWR